jgi:hypothetical protein
MACSVRGSAPLPAADGHGAPPAKWVDDADEARLSLWAERILSAETLEDVLAE